jgi:hypothetical protein
MTSTAKRVAPTEIQPEKWFQLRSAIMEAFPEFSVSDIRGDNEKVLKRSGRSGAYQEYLLKLNPDGITIAAGKDVAVETLAQIYHLVWKAVDDHVGLTTSTLSEFDILLTWDLPTRGNPYLSAILPGLAGSALQGLRSLFVYEFDPRIRFQPNCNPLEPVWHLDIISPYGYAQIARITNTQEDNEVRVRLGIGLHADAIGALQNLSFKQIAVNHWAYVTELLEKRIYSQLIDPMLRAIERGAAPASDARGSRETNRSKRIQVKKAAPRGKQIRRE